MPPTLDEQINQLKRTIADIESQKSILGDEAVEASLKPIRRKLADLESMADSPTEDLFDIPERKRRLVTLLFLDVVGSTAMTQNLDPEDTLDMMDHALKRLAVPIGAHAGRVTRFTGDGFKAIFGDPVSREDDPEQAIRAGLEILELSKFISQEIEKEWGLKDFKVRIGIDTGLAALGGQTESEDTVMGKVVNLAVRIESAASPGSLLISHNTYRHVRGVFNVRPQEPISAKGFPEPVPVYLVENIKPRAFRVFTRGVEGVETQMVGRETDFRFLQDALLNVIEENEEQVVTILGEAGVGKSRLLYEFKNWIELLHDDVRLFQAGGRLETRGQPYSLLRDLFIFRFQILDDDSGVDAGSKLENGFMEVFGDNEEALMRAHILGQLLGFDFSTSPHLKGVLNDPEQLRNRGLMYLSQYFQALSRQNPVVIILEDLHWGDNSSLDLVMRLVEYSQDMPLLILGAARPILLEDRPYWGEGLDCHKQLELQPLSKRDNRKLVDEILKLATDIPTELLEMIVNGSEGNPFYAEELIKMLIDEGVVIPDEEAWQIDMSQLNQVYIPSTLTGVLQARLDRLPKDECEVLQQASVIGRLFWDRILVYIQIQGGNEDDSQLIPQTLTSLRNRELIYRHEESAFVGSVEYLFKHDILREVTYESVIKRLRKTYHRIVADWLIKNTGDRVKEYYSVIAEHLLQAGRVNEACEYFYQAGQTALSSYANLEAEGFYQKSLELSPPREMHANILAGLGEALYKQGKLVEAEKIWHAAIDLYQELGDYDRSAHTYARLSRLLWHINQSEAWKFCQLGLTQLEGSPDSPGYARLLTEAGRIAYFRSKSDQVLPLCQRALEIAERLGDMEAYLETKITMTFSLENTTEIISNLENVVQLAEENGFLRVAARAHHNLSGQYFRLNLLSTLQHLYRAAEIYKQMGNIGSMMLSLDIYSEYSTEFGQLNDLELELEEFLDNISIPDELEKEFWGNVHRQLFTHKGEWWKAVEATRNTVQNYRMKENLSGIYDTNLYLVEIILELNQFERLEDLSEANDAIEEILAINHYSEIPQLYMCIVHARRGNIHDAHEWLKKSEYQQGGNEDDLTYKQHHSYCKFELAYAEGLWSDAVSIIEANIEELKTNGQRWNWARDMIRLGDSLINRNESGDLERAREAYQQSLDMFTEMGAPGYVKVLEERLGELQGS